MYIFNIYHPLVAQRLKRLPAMWETWVRSLGQEDPLEKEMATHSCILAWRIPWMEESGGLQSMGSQRVRHDWATSFTLFSIYMCHIYMYKYWIGQYLYEVMEKSKWTFWSTQYLIYMNIWKSHIYIYTIEMILQFPLILTCILMGDIYTFISSVSLEKPDWYTQQSLGTMTPICIKCKSFPSSHYQEMKQDLVWETCPWICMWFGNGRAGFWSQRLQTFVLETFKSTDHSSCMSNWQPWWIQDTVTGRCDGRWTEHFAWYSCVLGTAFCRGQGIGPQEKLLCASPPACEMGRDDGNDRIVSER